MIEQCELTSLEMFLVTECNMLQLAYRHVVVACLTWRSVNARMLLHLAFDGTNGVDSHAAEL